jgi:hypothetical protein
MGRDWNTSFASAEAGARSPGAVQPAGDWLSRRTGLSIKAICPAQLICGAVLVNAKDGGAITGRPG